MIGKIVTGKSFKGVVEYVMNKKHARLLACDGVDDTDARSVTDGFNFQHKARPEIAKVVGHISLSFHPDDAPKLTDEMMLRLAGEYMRRMGITDTQYVVARHHDTEHPHIHIRYNRVRYDRKLVPDNNERRRNTKVCKALKQKYGLTFSEGKKKIKAEKLHGPDAAKYAIYEAVKSALPGCRSLEALAGELMRQGAGGAGGQHGRLPYLGDDYELPITISENTSPNLDCLPEETQEETTRTTTKIAALTLSFCPVRPLPCGTKTIPFYPLAKLPIVWGVGQSIVGR